MAYRVTWSSRAVEDLEAIAQYISADSAAYAASVVKTILNSARNLSHFPFAGRVVPELGDENIREWLAYSYRVIYRVEKEVDDREYKDPDKEEIKSQVKAVLREHPVYRLIYRKTRNITKRLQLTAR
jgi:toxin ParE1/3/4